ncbi:MAG: cyclic nucleotide-binding domain-containing protein [Bacteroidaceae bacterium]|nr:cyclic nucleotide-binding domain-containing protein [Bacteroidales bacterium]MBQ8695214.1 cyclic nucleotide-binding domain-containing protein [Bacteroidaceae bacterium]MBR3615258.1 cyclic nucleotide-binding domain-containing protein [Bacteroidaceae bacterium]
MENIIAKIRSYYPVGNEALQEMLESMIPMRCPKNTRLVHSGTTDRNIYFIEEGVTRSIFHKDGTDTTTWFSLEGDTTFGMHSLYHNTPSVESVETLTDCLIYTMPIEKLNALYEKYIDIANWGRVIHQECNILLSHLFVERLQLPPKERYRKFLEHYPGLLNRVKLKYVAEFLGISIYTLSRIRSGK